MKKTISAFFVLAVTFVSQSQQTFINTDWSSTGGSISSIQRTASALDNNENLIVVSNTVNSSNNTDVLITKFDAEGTIIWQQTYNGASNGDDYGVQVKINQANEIFVAASVRETLEDDFGILKYSSTGNLIWSSYWNGQANGIDIPADLGIDNSGNVYIVGGSEASNGFSDYAIVKFNSAGVFQWYTNYNYANLHDAASSLEFNSGDLIVTGGSASTATNWDIATLKINMSNGFITTSDRASVAGVGLDNAIDIVTDASNNIYIAGHVEINGNKNIQLIKLNSNFGLEWTQNFDGGFEDVAKAIAIDGNGNTYIAGFKENSNGGKDYITLKYDATGSQIWTKEFGSEGNNYEAIAEDISILDNNSIVVTGTVNKNGNTEIVTIKYSPSGALKVVKKFDGGNQQNEAKSIITDGNFIYVSGVYENNGVDKDITIKYEQIEKNIDFVLNSSGKPVFEKNDLIVRLDTSAIKKEMIDNREFQAGKIDDFLKPTAAHSIRNAVKNYCNECDITVYKIFKQLTTNNSTTTSRMGETIPIPHFWATLLLEFPQGVDVTIAADDIGELFPLVKYVQPNLTAEETSIVPNDFHYQGGQENLHADASGQNGHINIQPAWALETGKPFIKVGVMDSGVQWTHEDFGDGTSSGTKIVDGWDFRNGFPMFSNQNFDSTGHGTKCAGIIGAIRNNSIGVAGIAGGKNNSVHNLDSMGVSLYGMRILEPFNMLTNIADAIVTSSIDDPSLDYAFGLHVMNNSWGINEDHEDWFTDTNITLLTEATHFANRAKVTFIAARGNAYIVHQHYPAIIDDDWILCVGGTNRDGNHLDGSGALGERAGVGWEIDIAAPGTALLVKTTHSNGGYGGFNATSAATPHVSGVAGLLMSYLNHPNSHHDNLAPEDVEQILQMTAVDKHTPGKDSLTGYGLLDGGAALYRVHKGVYEINHYGTDVNSNATTVSLESANDTVILSESFENVNSQWFLGGIKYIVNTYKIKADVYHPHSPLDSAVAYWPRPSSSNVFAHFDSDNVVEPRERISVDSTTSGLAVLSGYIYEVSDSLGNHLGWWPIDTAQTSPQLTYSLLNCNTATLGIISEKSELSHVISVYPNPTDRNQIISIDLNQSAKVKIELFDISGKLVLDVFEGNLDQGNRKLDVPLSILSDGIYVYKFIIDDISYHSKIIKR